MGVIPKVSIKPTQTKIITQPGMAGNIAVIGAFDTDVNTLKAYTGLRQAQEALGVSETLMGCKVLDKLFQKNRGASSVLVSNITTGDEGSRETDLTIEKLAKALNQIKGEKYDILFVAAELEDAAVEMVREFLDESYDLQKPVGTVLALTRTNTEAYIDTLVKFKKGSLYGALCQEFTMTNGVKLSKVESAAYYCGIIAGNKVDQSMTMSQLPEVIDVTPEYVFSDEDDGEKLVAAGMTVIRCMDRANNKFVVVNSEQPSGLDLYMERTKDFIIRDIGMEEFLGDKNTSNTWTSIKSVLENKKQLYVNTLNMLLDLNYDVLKGETPNCVKVYLDSLVFAGVITEIDVYVVVEVE